MSLSGQKPPDRLVPSALTTLTTLPVLPRGEIGRAHV